MISPLFVVGKGVGVDWWGVVRERNRDSERETERA
jgi:hypothetical protein